MPKRAFPTKNQIDEIPPVSVKFHISVLTNGLKNVKIKLT